MAQAGRVEQRTLGFNYRIIFVYSDAAGPVLSEPEAVAVFHPVGLDKATDDGRGKSLGSLEHRLSRRRKALGVMRGAPQRSEAGSREQPTIPACHLSSLL